MAECRHPSQPELLVTESGVGYRLTAEVRQEAAFDRDARVGVYVARQAPAGGPAEQQAFARLTFADLGPRASQARGPGGRPGGQAEFGPALLGPGPVSPVRGHYARAPAVWYPAPAASGPGPWRALEIEVRATGIRACWGADPVGEVAATGWVDWFRLLPRLYPDLTDFGGPDSFAYQWVEPNQSAATHSNFLRLQWRSPTGNAVRMLRGDLSVEYATDSCTGSP